METEPGSMVIRQSMEALRSISSCLSCTVRTWKSCAFSPLGVLVSGSLRPVTGCCRGVQYWIVWEILQLRNAWFDSGYMFCISA